MIEQHQHGPRVLSRRCWQAFFAVAICAIIALELSPQLSASALYLLTDGITTVVAGGLERVSADRILETATDSTGTDVVLEANRKVAIHRNGNVQYATSRENETVSALLQREGVRLAELEMVRVDVSGEEILLEIASDFTYYETAAEAAAYGTVYQTDYTIPKGETKVTQQGVNGRHEVTYEITYADGRFVSRQAIAEQYVGVEAEVVSTGTLVREAQPGDTIETVIRNDDGSGYLILKSGDSLHFTGTMDVKCTAYSSEESTVGTITATGTRVHTGVVAVDKSVIPLGTRMFITTAKGDITYGMGHAEDTGVRGRVVDLYMNTLRECIQFGVRNSVLYILDP